MRGRMFYSTRRGIILRAALLISHPASIDLFSSALRIVLLAVALAEGNSSMSMGHDVPTAGKVPFTKYSRKYPQRHWDGATREVCYQDEVQYAC